MSDELQGREALSVGEAAAAAGISRGLFYSLLRDGAGPRTIKLRRRRLVRVEALREWLLSREKGGGHNDGRN